MIRLIIVDDHSIFAESLQIMLQQDENISVEAIALNGNDAVSLCKSLMPDLVLLDLKMPGLNGIETTRIIKNICPKTKVAILTTFEDFNSILESYVSRIDGYILKDVRGGELVTAVKCICSGFQVIHGEVGKFLQKEFAVLSEESKNQKGLFKDEDIEIIRYISDGLSNKEIGKLMNYTEGTIKNKISKLIEVFGVKDRTQVVVYALKNNLI